MTTVEHRASPRLTVVAVGGDVPADVRRELCASDPTAMPTQGVEWLGALTGSGDFVDASRLYETDRGERVLLPLVRRTATRGRLAVLHSYPPAWGFGGLIAPGGTSAGLLSAVVDDLQNLGALRIHLRPNPLHASDWRAATVGRRGVTAVPARAHVLDLAGGFTEVWERRFVSGTRTAARRAGRLGITVEAVIGAELLAEYRTLSSASVERWAARQREPLWLARLRADRRDPQEKLERIARDMGEACTVRIARIDGRPAAGTVVLASGLCSHYTRGAFDEEVAGNAPVNVALHVDAIRAACDAGHRWYHMGESGGSAGLSQFKRRFGAVAHDYDEYWIERLPLHRMDAAGRRGVKQLIGFRDA